FACPCCRICPSRRKTWARTAVGADEAWFPTSVGEKACRCCVTPCRCGRSTHARSPGARCWDPVRAPRHHASRTDWACSWCLRMASSPGPDSTVKSGYSPYIAHERREKTELPGLGRQRNGI